MFGNWAKLFGQTDQPFGMGTIQQKPAQQADQKPSFLERLAGTLGEVGAAFRDDPSYYQGYQNNQTNLQLQRQRQLLEQQQMEQRQQEEEAKRAYERDNYVWKSQYDRDNPKPSDDAFTRAMAAAGIQPGTPEYVQMAKQRAQMLTQPVQLVPDGMGGMTAVRPNAMEAPETITEDMWNSGTPIGGAASPASRPFQQAFPQGIFQTR